MNVGVIARADDRGLGNQTWEVCRHLQPDRVLVVRVPGSERQGFAPHLDRFPGATVVTVDESDWSLPVDEVRSWLDGLDVVWSAESLYDGRLPSWARDQHVATVVQVNPEFWFPGQHRPDVVWSATDWRLDTLPADTRVVPMPVPVDRWPAIIEGSRRILHVAGRPATGDRNGSDIVARALHHLDGVDVVVMNQLDCPLEHYWDLYHDFAALLLPRRYGGLCLPANEACGAGLVPIMSDLPPNRHWPIIPIPMHEIGTVKLPAGKVPQFDADPAAVAGIIRTFLDGDVDERRRQARRWADDHSWDALLPLWQEELGRAADRGRRLRTSGPTVEVVIPFRAAGEHRARALDWVVGRYRSEGLTVTVAELHPGESWRKAIPVRQAVAGSDADVVVVADADVWCDGLGEAINHVAAHGGWAVPHLMVHRLTEQATAEVTSGGALDLAAVEREPYQGILGGGIVVLERAIALDVPLDPRFVGWGGEDRAWAYALECLHGKPWRGRHPLIHLWHPPQADQDPARRNGSETNEMWRQRYRSRSANQKKMRILVDEARALLQEASR